MLRATWYYCHNYQLELTKSSISHSQEIITMRRIPFMKLSYQLSDKLEWLEKKVKLESENWFTVECLLGALEIIENVYWILKNSLMLFNQWSSPQFNS